MQLTQKVIDFLLLIKENGGKMTKSDQDMFDAVRYYVMVKYISDLGLIHSDGMNKQGQKLWRLNKKGIQITDLLKQIVDIYHNENNKEVVNDGKAKGKGNSA
jgi:hypothetical protein